MTNTVATMNVDGLDNPERAKLLSVVDEFRALGISKEISLPQLVVVGDQSSGKSSLLEGLTGISFPTHSGLCTRFATRIILRRSADRQAKVSIIPGASSVNDASRRDALLAFNPKVDPETLMGPRFTEIMDEAAVAMGLPPSTQKDIDNLDRRFSDDIFSIELSGPKQRHLSIVDVPGLFHNPTSTQTESDLNTILTMIESYMEDERTIMLTVMDALNNFANQEIFKMAKAADPTGERTVGVITKCDAVSADDEEPIIKVAQNETYVFRHGWFAVRNRSTSEKKQGTTLEQRHKKEVEFFETAPWSELSKDRVGVPALKTYLSQILYDHIRNEFPQLVDDIRNKLNETRQQMAGFGDSRSTPSEQRHYLTRIAHEFQTNNTEACKGNYSAMLEANDPRRLRMHIALENDNFASRIHDEGHLHWFKKVDGNDQKAVAAKNQDNSPANGSVKKIPIRMVVPLPKRAAHSHDVAESHSSVIESDAHMEVQTTDIYDWIRDRYRMSRGAELTGTVNPAVLEGLFRQQASPWGQIAADYLETVNNMVLRHIDRSCLDLITDKSIRNKVNERNKRAIIKTREVAVAELNQILEDEMGGILQTTNHYFAENLAKNRHARLVLRFKKYFDPMDKAAGNGVAYPMALNIDDLIKQTYLSNEESAVYDIHDILEAYYKVAMKRFIDTVILQVAERHYLGVKGPLKYFSPAYVGGLSDDELRSLAGESKATSMERERLTTLLGQLDRALKLGEAEL